MIPKRIADIYEEAGIIPKVILYSVVVKKPKNSITRTGNVQLKPKSLNSRD